MASTATSFGDGRWGIPAEETGFIIESVSHQYKQDSKQVKDRTGNDSGVTYYNEKVTGTLKGRVPKTSPFNTALATSLTLGNTLSANLLKGGTTTGLVIVESITFDYANEDYQSVSVDFTKYPNIVS